MAAWTSAGRVFVGQCDEFRARLPGQGLVSTGIGRYGPDVQIMFADVPLRADALPGPDIGLGYTIAVSLMAPFSRGSLRLASSVPGAAPVIDPHPGFSRARRRTRG